VIPKSQISLPDPSGFTSPFQHGEKVQGVKYMGVGTLNYSCIGFVTISLKQSKSRALFESLSSLIGKTYETTQWYKHVKREMMSEKFIDNHFKRLFSHSGWVSLSESDGPKVEGLPLKLLIKLPCDTKLTVSNTFLFLSEMIPQELKDNFQKSFRLNSVESIHLRPTGAWIMPSAQPISKNYRTVGLVILKKNSELFKSKAATVMAELLNDRDATYARLDKCGCADATLYFEDDIHLGSTN
jgi:hypothetical protein